MKRDENALTPAIPLGGTGISAMTETHAAETARLQRASESFCRRAKPPVCNGGAMASGKNVREPAAAWCWHLVLALCMVILPRAAHAAEAAKSPPMPTAGARLDAAAPSVVLLPPRLPVGAPATTCPRRRGGLRPARRADSPPPAWPASLTARKSIASSRNATSAPERRGRCSATTP